MGARRKVTAGRCDDRRGDLRVHAFTIRDGAIERLCMYQHRKEALEAVGLSK
jgi:hypothetical protein